MLIQHRYIRAFEVGRNPSSSKYEMAVRLRTLRNGPVIRNTFRLPHPVKTDLRICVIATPGSKAATEARSAGATLVGEDEIFAQVKAGTIDFDRILCHIDSLPALNKAGLGRILGPRGLMPSTKTNTVVSTASAIGAAVRNLVGGSEYRERQAVIRMAVGQLGFTPEEMKRNVTAFMAALRKDIDKMKDRINKEIHEVVSCIAVCRRSIVADCATGPQFYQRTRLHAERRLQRRQLDSGEGSCWTDVGSMYTRFTNSTPPQGVRRPALMNCARLADSPTSPPLVRRIMVSKLHRHLPANVAIRARSLVVKREYTTPTVT